MTISESPRVAYADDDAVLLGLGETYLRKFPSFEVTTCSGPRVAFDIVRDSDIDCVISNYDMPAVTGVELFETIHEDHDSLPLILFTGKGSEEVASDAISAGVTDYLQRQPSPKQCELPVSRIESNVSEHRTTRRAERYETVLEALSYPVYIADERGRFEYVNNASVGHDNSEVTVTVGRTHDGFYVEDDDDDLPDDRSPEEYFEAGGNEHRDGELTRRRRLNFQNFHTF